MSDVNKEESTPAQLVTDEAGNLYSAEFEDYYSAKTNALAETRYVFLEGNQLPGRWQCLQQFVIAELGFGTGLNFLSTWQAWQSDKNRCQRLHYFACEKHPVSVTALRDLLAQWPELAVYTAELLENYPPLLTGTHRLSLATGQVTLTLCFMDVATALQEWVVDVDCWYLDGFAPARNYAMWDTAVMQAVASLSYPMRTTLATFTAASVVRRNLQAAGFVVSKRKGFGSKREMLTAVLPSESAAAVPDISAWYSRPSIEPGEYCPKQPLAAVVIGGGIAGCQAARALAERGWRVTLLERHVQLAQEASGNRAGVLTPKMTAYPDWGERFYRQAFLHTLRQLHALQHQYGDDLRWSACGALQLNHNERETKRWQALSERDLPPDFIQLLTRDQASTRAGVTLPYGGSFFPNGGWIDPQSYCDVLVRHTGITVLTETAALGIERIEQEEPFGWRVWGDSLDQLLTNVVVVANGRDVHQLLDDAYLPLRSVKGQTSAVNATSRSQNLKVTLGHEGYFTPAVAGQHIFGATFERDRLTTDLDAKADAINLKQFATFLPALAEGLENVNSSHAALRMTTPDRYPYVGALPDMAHYLAAYADLKHGRTQKDYQAAQYVPGLFVMAGFGSRGLTTSSLCASLLASLINREPLPIEKSLYYKLHPARFLLKRIKQNRV